MDIKTTTTEHLKVSVLRPNEGQIPDVPANPRYITEQEFEALKASIQQDNLTGVLQMKVYNYEGEWIVLDGNMRLKALQDLGLDEVQCLIVPQGTDAKTLRKIVISANSTFGNWDMDMIANEWDADEAREWGVDIPEFFSGYEPNLNPTDDVVRGVTDKDFELASEHISNELTPGEKNTMEVTCPHCGKTFVIKV